MCVCVSYNTDNAYWTLWKHSCNWILIGFINDVHVNYSNLSDSFPTKSLADILVRVIYLFVSRGEERSIIIFDKSTNVIFYFIFYSRHDDEIVSQTKNEWLYYLIIINNLIFNRHLNVMTDGKP